MGKWPRCEAVDCRRELSPLRRSDARWCSPACRERQRRRDARVARMLTELHTPRVCVVCGKALWLGQRADARRHPQCRGRRARKAAGN